MVDKPKFSRDQVINASDVQRKWKEKVAPKLAEHPYLMLFSGSEPKAAVMSYDQFEELWEKSQEVEELRLQLEIVGRMLVSERSKKTLVPLAELVAESGISLAELEGDVDVEAEPE